MVPGFAVVSSVLTAWFVVLAPELENSDRVSRAREEVEHTLRALDQQIGLASDLGSPQREVAFEGLRATARRLQDAWLRARIAPELSPCLDLGSDRPALVFVEVDLDGSGERRP